MISRDAIAGLIPHGPGMSLIDEVIHHDAKSIEASTRSHQDPDNPLRTANSLNGIHCVEYAAQAMAIHGALLANDTMGNEPVRAPRLAIGGLKDVEIEYDDLSKLIEPLTITATIELSATSGAIYQFEIHHIHSIVAKGRITLIQDGT